MPRAMDLNRVFAALDEAGIRVRSMRTKSNRLEELFVRLTGDEAAAEAGTGGMRAFPPLRSRGGIGWGALLVLFFL